MGKLLIIISTFAFMALIVTAKDLKNSKEFSNLTQIKEESEILNFQNKTKEPASESATFIIDTTTEGINYNSTTSLSSSLSTTTELNTSIPFSGIEVTVAANPSSSTSSSSVPLPTTPALTTPEPSTIFNKYCSPTLCEFYNGSHTNIKPHIACKNSGNFSPACGSQPHLLKMSERRRNLILDLHNLARSRIATGQVEGYKSASHMPQLKWDNELEYLASLHVKRCKFEHDSCHNSERFSYSGQNIGYFWKAANITSHSKRMKNFIVNWYKEHKEANQSFIDSFYLHPEQKVIGHFTAMMGDRVHHVGCATIRYYESNLTKMLMTCNYDYNNFLGEPVYQTGPAATKCAYKISEKYPGLCDWKEPAYEYEPVEEDLESSGNLVYRV